MPVYSLKKCLSFLHHSELTFVSPIPVEDSLNCKYVYVDVYFERSEPLPSSEQTVAIIFMKGNTSLSTFPFSIRLIPGMDGEAVFFTGRAGRGGEGKIYGAGRGGAGKGAKSAGPGGAGAGNILRVSAD